MKKWHEDGVPLPIVIEAIDAVFERNETSGRKKVDLQSQLLPSFDQGAVVGAAKPLCRRRRCRSGGRPRGLAGIVGRAAGNLRGRRAVRRPRSRARFGEKRPEDRGAAHGSRTRASRCLDHGGSASIEAIRADIALALALGDTSKLDEKTRARTEEANLRRLVREKFGLPRLTLFGDRASNRQDWSGATGKSLCSYICHDVLQRPSHLLHHPCRHPPADGGIDAAAPRVGSTMQARGGQQLLRVVSCAAGACGAAHGEHARGDARECAGIHGSVRADPARDRVNLIDAEAMARTISSRSGVSPMSVAIGGAAMFEAKRTEATFQYISTAKSAARDRFALQRAFVLRRHVRGFHVLRLISLESGAERRVAVPPPSVRSGRWPASYWPSPTSISASAACISLLSASPTETGSDLAPLRASSQLFLSDEVSGRATCAPRWRRD